MFSLQITHKEHSHLYSVFFRFILFLCLKTPIPPSPSQNLVSHLLLSKPFNCYSLPRHQIKAPIFILFLFFVSLQQNSKTTCLYLVKLMNMLFHKQQGKKELSSMLTDRQVVYKIQQINCRLFLQAFLTYLSVFSTPVDIIKLTYQYILDMTGMLKWLTIICLAQIILTQGNGTLPPITSSVAFTITPSPADLRFITSEELQYYRVVHFPNPASSNSSQGDNDTDSNPDFTNSTDQEHQFDTLSNISLTTYNSSSATFQTTYTITRPGQWYHVESSPQTLSCSVFFEETYNLLGLLQFDKENSVYQWRGQVPMSVFGPIFSVEQIRNLIVISQDCQLLEFTSGQGKVLYHTNQNLTAFAKVTYPSGWSLQATSVDLLHFISANKLYIYNQNTTQLVQKYNFGTNTQYIIRNHKHRIVVAAINTTTTANSTTFNTSSYTIYTFDDEPSSFVLIDKFSLNNLQEPKANPFHLFTSSELTKIIFGYDNFTENKTYRSYMVKYIDYMQNKAYVIQFPDEKRFAQTVEGVDLQKQVQVDDNFVVVRNSSEYTNSSVNNTGTPVQMAFQFVGQQLLFLRQRVLSNSTNNKEINQFLRLWVDRQSTDTLIVLDVYRTNSSLHQIVRFVYGTILSNNPPPSNQPSQNTILTFVQPQNYSDIDSTQNISQWVYTKVIIANQTSTVLNIYRLSRPNDGLIKMQVTVDGGWLVLTQNEHCMVLGDISNNYTLYRYNNDTNNYEMSQDIGALIGNPTLTPTLPIKISEKCDRLFFNGALYMIAPQTIYSEVQTNNTWTAFDHDLTIGLADDNTIWKLEQNTLQGAGFTQIYTLAGDYQSNAELYAWRDAVVVAATTGTYAAVTAVNTSATNGTILAINNTYNAQPQIHVSHNLNKILIAGTITSGTTSKPFTVLFDINYALKTVKQLNLPSSSLLSIPNSNNADTYTPYIALSDTYLYLRNEPNNSNIPQPRQQLYFFRQQTVLVNIYTKNIVELANQTFVRAEIQQKQMGKFRLLKEVLVGSIDPKNRTVRADDLNGQEEQEQVDNRDNPRYVVEIQNGIVTICRPGCAQCACTSCLSGYVHDSALSICKKCAPGCTRCSLANPSQCSACAAGTFLNSTSRCQPCAGGCVTCKGSSTNCTACPPGQLFLNSSCVSQCPPNCFNCTSTTSCFKCRQGYVLTSTNTCRPCALSCSQCQQNNITRCTGCGAGLQLNSLTNKCQLCPANCLQCNNGKCAICRNGYIVDDSGICVVKCNLPCVTCGVNKPDQCLTCQAGSILAVENKTCVVDLTCNTNQNCTNCGQGLNYILVTTSQGSSCQPCPNITNCIQCDPSNSFACSLCLKGYYVDADGACQLCNSSCLQCKSDSICTSCALTSTFMTGYTQGSCLACQSPCVTCQGSPTACTSCISSTTQINYRCRNNTYIRFIIVINADPSNVLLNIDAIIAGFLQIIGELSNTNGVNFDSIASGSTVLSGNVEPDSASNMNNVASTLASGLRNGIPGTNYTVSSVNVAAQGTNNNNDDNDDGTNTGAIIGGVIGGVVGLILIIVIIVCCIKKNRKSREETYATPNTGSNAVFVQSSPKKYGQKIGSESGENYGLKDDDEL